MGELSSMLFGMGAERFAANREIAREQASNDGLAEAQLRGIRSFADKMRASLIDERGNAAGQVALKNAALAEIQKLDPSNWLLNQENRAKIYDAAKEKRVREDIAQ